MTEIKAANTDAEQNTGEVASLIDPEIEQSTFDLWANLASKTDHEIFKRNIYPGNGMGIAQYMGGDIGDIGITKAVEEGVRITNSTGVDPDGQADPTYTISQDDKRKDSDESHPVTITDKILTGPSENITRATSRAGNIRALLGLNNANTDDDGIFDEVSFRAQTHMKTVWDLFLVCAGLQPDYIVAVRPFEDRSTVFYGKPYWNYTSGLIPISTGATASGAIIEPDNERRDIIAKIYEGVDTRDEAKKFESAQASLYDPGANYGRKSGGNLGGPRGGAVPGGVKVPKLDAEQSKIARIITTLASSLTLLVNISLQH